MKSSNAPMCHACQVVITIPKGVPWERAVQDHRETAAHRQNVERSLTDDLRGRLDDGGAEAVPPGAH